MQERRPLEWMEWLHSRHHSGSLWSTTCAHSTEQHGRSAGFGFPSPEPLSNGRLVSRLCEKEPHKRSCGSPWNRNGRLTSSQTHTVSVLDDLFTMRSKQSSR